MELERLEEQWPDLYWNKWMQFFQGDLFMYILLNNHLTKKQLGKAISPFSWLNRFTDPLLSHVYGIEKPV